LFSPSLLLYDLILLAGFTRTQLFANMSPHVYQQTDSPYKQFRLVSRAKPLVVQFPCLEGCHLCI
jgi:hypothetical protein